MGGKIQGHVSRANQLGHNVVAFCDDAGQNDRSLARHKSIAQSVKLTLTIVY